MLVLPAIDLQAGKCVRLLQGDFDRETIYGEDPVVVAQRWHDAGPSLLHVVDLDGARAGYPVQSELIGKLAEVMPVQVGGGLRTEDSIDHALQVAARVVLGTAALDRDFITRVAQTHGERLIVALDTRGDQVTVAGWTEAGGWGLLDLAQELMQSGVCRFLHTDVERDGALTSPNYRSLEALIRLGTPVIASGGVSSLDDIKRLREMGAEAVIVGRALYEGTISLEEAVKIAG